MCCCFCVRDFGMLTWFPSYLHASFVATISFKCGPSQRSNTCLQPPACAGWASCRGRSGREDGSSWEEEERGSQPPRDAAATRSETCHSAGDGSFNVQAWGINLYQKGSMSEPLERRQESEIKVWNWVYPETVVKVTGITREKSKIKIPVIA